MSCRQLYRSKPLVCLLDNASDSSIGYVAAASRSAAKKISSEISFVAYLPTAVVI